LTKDLLRKLLLHNFNSALVLIVFCMFISYHFLSTQLGPQQINIFDDGKIDNPHSLPVTPLLCNIMYLDKSWLDLSSNNNWIMGILKTHKLTIVTDWWWPLIILPFKFYLWLIFFRIISLIGLKIKQSFIKTKNMPKS